MARQQATSTKFESVNITTTENGYIVRIGDDMRNCAPLVYSFETFASMTKWLSKNLEGGAA